MSTDSSPARHPVPWCFPKWAAFVVFDPDSSRFASTSAHGLAWSLFFGNVKTFSWWNTNAVSRRSRLLHRGARDLFLSALPLQKANQSVVFSSLGFSRQVKMKTPKALEVTSIDKGAASYAQKHTVAGRHHILGRRHVSTKSLRVTVMWHASCLNSRIHQTAI